MNFILPVVATVLLGSILILKMRDSLALPLSLVIAGGISNYIDLIRFGYVRDPLSIGTFVFNVADIFILIGTFWAIWVYTRR